MKLPLPSPRSRAFTAWDLLIVSVTVFLAVGFLLPWLASRHPTRAKRIHCVNNLKQIGLAFRDHETLPWLVSTNQGGSKEYIETGEVFRHYLAASNELNSPRVLVCPSDSTRTRMDHWTNGFGNQNLSYFLSLDADETRPETILAGDRNILGGSMVNSNLMLLATNRPAGWGKDIHNGCGNVVFADGSAGYELTPSALQQKLLAGTNAVIRLAIP